MTSTGITQRMSRRLLLGALFCGVAAAAHAEAPADRTPHAVAEQRIVISATIVMTDVSEAATFTGSLRLPHGIMLHRITMEVAGAEGVVADAAFVAKLSAVAPQADRRMLARFTSSQPVFELPRPLGLRLEADEHVQVHGSISGTAAGALQIIVTLEYEALDSRVSRLAVQPLQIQLADALTYEWRAPVDGRVMALAGVPSDLAGELILEDAETGAALWREVLQPLGGEAFGRRGDVVRIGAQVQEGRHYRLTLRPAEATDTAAADLLLHALLMPVRRTLIAAAQ